MKKDYLELRIFICFILTIFYVNYTVRDKDTEPNIVEDLQGKVLQGFEVRIINDYANERLELTDTLGEALKYIEKYSMHHEDLVAFDLSTGAKVASNGNGVGVINTGYVD
tara:strand:+ start:230 stop:559 length:330 start_codon:yes stop_codon:yes gene_type:complete